MAEQGDLRASHADRDQVIEVLKDAFVQGRLDHGQLDARVGQALASQTYAELAALTADIPAGEAPRLPARPRARQPARPQNRMPQRHPVRNGAVGVGASVAVAAAAELGAVILDDRTSVALFLFGAFIVLVAVPFIIMTTVVTALNQRRSRRQLPGRPGRGGHATETGRPGGAGPDRHLPGASPDETRADMSDHRSRPGRRPAPRWPRAWARRGLRPVPGAA